MIKQACPRCKASITIPDKLNGSKVACPRCKGRFTVQDPNNSSPKNNQSATQQNNPDLVKVSCPDCGQVTGVERYLVAGVSHDSAGKWINIRDSVKCPKCKTTYAAGRDPADAVETDEENAGESQPTKVIVSCVHCKAKAVIGADKIKRQEKGAVELAGPAQCPKCGETERVYKLEGSLDGDESGKAPEKKTARIQGKAVLDAVNEIREQYHLRDVVWNDRLAKAATHHALNMADFGQMAHELPESDTPTIDDRVGKSGYRYNEGDIAEIIAHNLESPEDLATGWYNSRKHRQAMLYKQFREAGVGYAQGDDGDVYVCMVFGIPSGNANPTKQKAPVYKGSVWDRIRDYLL